MFSALWAVFGHWQVLVGIVVLALLGVAYMYVKPFADLVLKLLDWFVDFARTTRGQIVIVSLCVCAGVTGGLLYIRHQAYEAGYAAAEAKAATEAAEALKARREFIAAMTLANVDAGRVVDERLRAKDAARAARTITITKEVTKYVPASADARCLVPAGFVWLHNAARAGLPATSAPSGPAIEADSGVALSDLAKDDARTVELYAACRDQVAETVAWYEGVRTRYATMKGSE